MSIMPFVFPFMRQINLEYNNWNKYVVLGRCSVSFCRWYLLAYWVNTRKYSNVMLFLVYVFLTHKTLKDAPRAMYKVPIWIIRQELVFNSIRLLTVFNINCNWKHVLVCLRQKYTFILCQTQKKEHFYSEFHSQSDKVNSKSFMWYYVNWAVNWLISWKPIKLIICT